MKFARYFALSIVILLIGVQLASAQIPTPFTLIVDEDSLTLVLPQSTAPTSSLQGLTFEIVTSTHARRTYSLAMFSSFAPMDFSRLRTPLCFQIQIENATTPRAQECVNYRTLVHVVQRAADRFWYDDAARNIRIIYITGGVGSDFCPNDTGRCDDMSFTPLEVTPTMQVSETPNLVVTPRSTNTSVPRATPIATQRAAGSAIREVEMVATGGAVVEVYTYDLPVNEIIVGEAWGFQNTVGGCVAFLIRGGQTKSFSVNDGAFRRYTGVQTDIEAERLLQNSVDYLRSIEPCRNREVQIVRI